MPRIHMTRMVKVSLYFLRIYLVILLTLIVVKFVFMFSRSHTPENSPPPPENTSRQ